MLKSSTIMAAHNMEALTSGTVTLLKELNPSLNSI